MSGIFVLGLRILMTVCLYAFIGFIVYLIWKDLRQQAAIASRSKIPLLTLQLQDHEPEVLFRIDQSESFIGRDPGCEIHIEDQTLSARHARLSYHHKQWWVEDLHSTNGTWLNDLPLLQTAVLDANDTLTCGEVHLLIQKDAD